jgi:hypothetical protein
MFILVVVCVLVAAILWGGRRRPAPSAFADRRRPRLADGGQPLLNECYESEQPSLVLAEEIEQKITARSFTRDVAKEMRIWRNGGGLVGLVIGFGTHVGLLLAGDRGAIQPPMGFPPFDVASGPILWALAGGIFGTVAGKWAYGIGRPVFAAGFRDPKHFEEEYGDKQASAPDGR